MDSIKELCSIVKTVRAVADSYPADSTTATTLKVEMDKLDRLIVSASFSMEALNPVFDLEGGHDGYLKVADLTYTAFMIGRDMENREEGGRTSWFTDAWPLMCAGIERIKKECIGRMQYAAQQQ